MKPGPLTLSLIRLFPVILNLTPFRDTANQITKPTISEPGWGRVTRPSRINPIPPIERTFPLIMSAWALDSRVLCKAAVPVH
jgi:hypothetical protein